MEVAVAMMVVSAGVSLIGGFSAASAQRQQSTFANQQALFQMRQAELHARQGEIGSIVAENAGRAKITERLRLLNQDLGAARVAAFASGFAGPGAGPVLGRIARFAKEDVDTLQTETDVQKEQSLLAGYSGAANTTANAASLYARSSQLRGAATQSLLQGITGAAQAGYGAYKFSQSG